MTDISPQEVRTDDLEGLDLTALDLLQRQLLGGRNDFDELSEDELTRFLAICNRMRLAGRPASKPAKDGGTKKKAIKAEPPSISDLLNSM
jgi:hypothetical protein